MPAAPQLRPLAIGEVLDLAIRITWRNAATLVRLVVLVIAPVEVLIAVVRLSLPSGSSASGGEVWARVGGAVLIGILLAIAATVTVGACFKAVADAYLGARPEFGPSLRFALSRARSILWVTLLAGVGTLLGAICLIVPGVYLWVSWSVAVPALLAEDVRGRRALGRSRRLVRGRFWPTFGVLLVGYVLSTLANAIVGAIVSGVLSSGGSSEAASAISTAASDTVGLAIAAPFQAAFLTVLYFDLRVRKEGFDLELLAQRVGLAAEAHAPLAPAEATPPPADEPPGLEPPFWPPPPGWRPPADPPEER